MLMVRRLGRGDNTWGQTNPPPGCFKEVALGTRFGCAIRTDTGAGRCWGDNAWGVTSPPPGQLSSISAGAYHACALKVDGSAVCWGSNSSAEANPPPQKFTRVAAGLGFSCGLKQSNFDGGEIVCWGAMYVCCSITVLFN